MIRVQETHRRNKQSQEKNLEQLQRELQDADKQFQAEVKRQEREHNKKMVQIHAALLQYIITNTIFRTICEDKFHLCRKHCLQRSNYELLKKPLIKISCIIVHMCIGSTSEHLCKFKQI